MDVSFPPWPRPLVHIQAHYPIHLKVDTGMGRLGFSPEELLSLLDDPLLRSPLYVEGMMTHLADADGADSAFTERQLSVFRVMLEQVRERGLTLPLMHTANSAAIVRFPEAHFSLVRPGIMLYGYHTLPATVPAPDLKPVLSLRTTIVQLRREGEQSANGTFVAKRPTRSRCCRSLRRRL
jgi:alanine racemase